MHFVFIVLSLVAVACEAGKLSSKYLPPSQQYAAASAGVGHPGLLQSPSHFNAGAGIGAGAYGGGYGGAYGGGRGAAAAPSNQYLAPQASNLHYSGVSGQGHVLQRPQQQQHQLLQQQSHASASNQIPILRSDYTNDANGNYNFGFDTGNGIHRDETGEFQGVWPHGSQSVMGSYSYTGDDGQTYTVNYKADDSGFHAEGAHLPTPPPIPAEIQESLALHHSPGRNAGAGIGGPAAGSYHAAASHQAPSAQYLPPQRQQQQQQGYNYGRQHY